MRAWGHRLCAMGALVLSVAGHSARAQQPLVRDSAKCDSIVAAARVDSQEVTIYITAGRPNGEPMPAEQASLLAATVGTAFIAPRPFRLPVFSGPAQTRLLRRVSDTLPELRVPTVTGVYRFTSSDSAPVAHLETVRAALIPGFDSAAIVAIQAAAVVKDILVRPEKQDSMRLEIRFSTDSMATSRRLATGWFPRMPVLDAVPRRDNPPAEFPEVEKLDSLSRGEVVLRFVVDRTGSPMISTIEVVRATALTFLRSALLALPTQRFSPARVDGCAVAQEVSYPFAFVMPSAPPRH